MISAEDSALTIYTDGSCINNPRRGGYGIRIYFPIILNRKEEFIELDSISYQYTSNNQMELLAVITALKYLVTMKDLHKVSRVIVFTDSQYVSENYNSAIFYWPKTKWFLRNGEPVQNAELWKDLVKVSVRLRIRIEIRWIKGHAKNKDNKVVDKIARQSAKRSIKKIFKPMTIRRKLSPNKVNPGSIESVGQRISIRVITDEYLPVQKLFKYKIEVISKKSKYYNCVDFVYSEMLLKAGHSYVLSLKKSESRLVISKVINEIVKESKQMISSA